MTIFGRQRRVPSSKTPKSRRKEFQRRALGAEPLEARALMDAGELAFVRNAFWNINKPVDVNADGQVTAFDALGIINDLNSRGARSLATTGPAGPSGGEGIQGTGGHGFIDVNNDNYVTALDALAVINRLNNPSAGEGEPMMKMTVQIVAPGTNADITEVAKGNFYEVRILAEDLGVLTYMGQTRPTTNVGTGETTLGVVTTFFDLQYPKNITEFQVNEIQNIAITSATNGGDFTLTVNDNGTLKTTAAIDFAANRNIVTSNIQAALNNILGPNVAEVTRGDGTTNWRVRFINRLADRNMPSITGTNISLGGAAAITVTEFQSGDPNNAIAIADAFRLRTFYDSDSNPLNDDPVFYTDQRNGNKDTFGINDIGGSNFQSPYPGITPTEIVRLRMTATDAGIVPFNISYLDVNNGLPTGLLGFSNAITTDLITIVNDSITIVEPLSAGNDSATLTENATAFTDINVTANDVNNSPTPSTPKTVLSVDTTGTVGTVQILNASTIRYTPPGTDFAGSTTFTYTVRDENNNTDTATVTINFTPVNDAPVVSGPTSQTFNEDTTRVFSNLNGNQITIADVDAAAGLVTMTLNVGAGNGNLTLASLAGLTGLSGNGSNSVTATGTVGDLNLALDGLSYTPALNLNGPVALAITANDNGNTPAPALQGSRNITLNLTAVNDAPNVELGGFVGTPDVVEGDPLILNSANNTLIQVSDPDAGTNLVQVTLQVTAGNTLNVNSAGLANLTGNGTNNLILSGTLAAINTALNGITYTPSATFGGNNESLTITINDQGNTGTGGPQSDVDNVTIIVDTSTRPRARADVKTVVEDSSAPATNTIDVLDNDIVNVPDPTVYVAELLSFDTISVNGGAVSRDDNGTPADFSDDQLIYVPAANFFGTDTFTYTMTDTKPGSTPATGTVTVTVTAVNDIPVPADDTLSNVAEDSGARTILASALIGNDNRGAANESAQTLTIAAVSNPVGGTVSINGSGDVVFTPTANYNGPASFTYTVTDNGQTNGANDFKTSLTSATASFTITEVNDVPTAGDITLANIAEDSPTYLIPISTLLASVSPGPANESGQTLTLNQVLAPNGGTVVINTGTGNVEFTPTPNFNGASGLRFIIEVFDNGTTNGAPLPLNVTTGVFFAITPVNDAPVAQADNASTGEGQQIDVAVLANDRDVDVNPPTGTAGQVQAGTTISIISQTPAQAISGTVSITAGNQIRFIPATGFFGQVVIEYQLNDNSGAPNNLSNITTLTIDVVEANDPPVANPDPGIVTDEDLAIAIDVFANDTDPDTAKANWSFVLVTPPAHGTAVFNTTTRVVDYTPAADYNGSDSFVYRINDNSPINPQSLLSGNALVSINVREVNDVPVGGTDPDSTGGRFTVIKDRDRTFTVASLLANDSPGAPANEAGQSISITGVTPGPNTNGTVTLNAGVITYTPTSGFIGNASFAYTLTDNGTTAGAADAKSVEVTVNLIVREFIPTTIEGYVYRDVNNNGTYDPTIDYPIAGAAVTLSGTSEVSGIIVPNTIETNHLGFYQFFEVEPGDYLLTEAQPLALTDGAETLGAAASFFANDQISLDLPLLGLTGGVSRNDFGEGGINAGALVNSAGLVNELLGSSTKNGFVLGTDLNANTIWSWSLNNWVGATSIKVDLDLADLSKATLTVTDANGPHIIEIFQSPTDPRNPNRNNPDAAARMARFRILGWDANGNYMIRIDGKASDWGLTLVAAPVPAMSAGEYVEGVDAAMAEVSWA